ncbi:hypothetical protein PR048_000621 [Dryococelus australis]|uniref:Uncharacterized protein n=1 Tax=Dryococelus australis TaxID=614101 RepID=A0ABQ9IG28_9NEOP|nr:hypothetical protein PR048_000621 [Dryococelus australis]
MVTYYLQTWWHTGNQHDGIQDGVRMTRLTQREVQIPVVMQLVNRSVMFLHSPSAELKRVPFHFGGHVEIPLCQNWRMWRIIDDRDGFVHCKFFTVMTSRGCYAVESYKSIEAGRSSFQYSSYTERQKSSLSTIYVDWNIFSTNLPVTGISCVQMNHKASLNSAAAATARVQWAPRRSLVSGRNTFRFSRPPPLVAGPCCVRRVCTTLNKQQPTLQHFTTRYCILGKQPNKFLTRAAANEQRAEARKFIELWILAYKSFRMRGATVDERLVCSPPTKAIRVQYPAGSLRNFACGNRAGRCRWTARFLGDLPSPPPFHSGAAPYSPQSPSSALKMLLTRLGRDIFLALLTRNSSHAK